MIIQKNKVKASSLGIGLWFSDNTMRWDNGKKSAHYRISLADIKSPLHFQKKLEEFLTNYVREA